MPTEQTLEPVQNPGQFYNILRRNNTAIREDRATQISEDSELIYRRLIEDIERDIIGLQRKRIQMMDVSPLTIESLEPAKGFDPIKFVEMDLNIGLKLRENEIRLEIAIERYQLLFGKTYQTS